MRLRPYQAPRRQPRINDMLYPPGSKQPGNVWVGGFIMNVPETSSSVPTTPTPTPSITPTNTPTQTQTGTPNVTSTPTNTPTQTQSGTPNVTPSPTQTGTPNVTSTPTNTPTQTQTPTNTLTPTPSVTANPICPEQLEFYRSPASSFSSATGTFTRMYTYTGGTFNGGYVADTTPRTFVPGTITGSTYAVYGRFDGSLYYYNIVYFPHSPNIRYNIYRTTGNYFINGVIPTESSINGFGALTDGSVFYPLNGGDSFTYLNYPAICPTSTPTNTPTNTQTPTNTPTQTQSGTPNPTATPTQTGTPQVTSSPTTTPTPTPPLSGTAEANLYLEAVYNTGGTLNSTISAATRTLFTSLVSNGLYNKIGVMYPLIGGTAASHAVEGKNPNGTRVTWYGGITHGVSGATGAPGGYGDSGYNFNAIPVLSQNSIHMSSYINLNPNINTTNEGFGAIDTAPTPNLYYQLINKRDEGYGGESYGRMGDVDGQANAYVSKGQGLGVSVRRSATDRELYLNGASLNTQTGSYNSNLVTLPCYVVAVNHPAGAVTGSNVMTWAWLSVGSSLTDAEVSTLNTIIQTFQTSLSRNAGTLG